ncbi:MAG: carbohydrate ABC transporter permease [Culicoidibacterales bacterium]
MRTIGRGRLKTLHGYSWQTGALEFLGISVLILYLLPFYLMVVNSLKTRREIFDNTTGLPEVFAWENYLQAMERMGIFDAFANSMIITVGSVALIIVVSALAAWMLVRNQSKTSKVVFYIFVAAMIIPFQAVMLPLVKWMGMLKIDVFNFQMIGTHYGLMFMYLGFGTSMSIFLYHGFIKSIPIEIEEAARIDGCSKWQTFWYIIFPILKPITVTVMVLNAIWIWNDFLLPFLTVGGTINTIPLAMNNFFGAFTKQWELAMAGLILAIIPIMIFYFFMQKHIIKGITQGAVK